MHLTPQPQRVTSEWRVLGNLGRPGSWVCKYAQPQKRARWKWSSPGNSLWPGVISPGKQSSQKGFVTQKWSHLRSDLCIGSGLYPKAVSLEGLVPWKCSHLRSELYTRSDLSRKWSVPWKLSFPCTCSVALSIFLPSMDYSERIHGFVQSSKCLPFFSSLEEAGQGNGCSS